MRRRQRSWRVSLMTCPDGSRTYGGHEALRSAMGGAMTPRPVRLLFVCVGNTCRSPLAVGVASAVLGARVHAESAGITETGCPATAEAIAVLRERFGIDLTAHRSRHFTEVALAQFDVLIALDPIVYTPLREQCKPRQNILYISAEINRLYPARCSSTPCERVRRATIAGWAKAIGPDA